MCKKIIIHRHIMGTIHGSVQAEIHSHKAQARLVHSHKAQARLVHSHKAQARLVHSQSTGQAGALPQSTDQAGVLSKHRPGWCTLTNQTTISCEEDCRTHWTDAGERRKLRQQEVTEPSTECPVPTPNRHDNPQMHLTAKHTQAHNS